MAKNTLANYGGRRYMEKTMATHTSCGEGNSYPLQYSSEKVMAPHSSTLAWKIPWTEDLVGCSPWGCKESDTTE